MSNLCDKCGQEVPFENDATFFHSIRLNDPDMMTCIPPCHLLPVIENGKVVCPGYPSTTLYLNGYMSAWAFFIEPVKALQYQAAYREMQRQATLLQALQETVQS